MALVNSTGRICGVATDWPKHRAQFSDRKMYERYLTSGRNVASILRCRR